MKTVDTGDIREAVWCDHVTAFGQWIHGTRPAIVVTTPRIHIIIEEGKVKLLCPQCFLKAVQLPLYA